MHSSKLTEIISPSFTSHSSNNLADVAARVISEFRQNNNNEYDHIFNFSNSNPQHENNDVDGNDSDNDKHDEEFEFAIMHESSNSSCHQHILQPQYPLFDTSLLLTVDPSLLKLVTHTVDIHRINRTKSLVVRLPLIKLFNEDRDFMSSEADDDDLEGVTPGTYCVWKPKANSQEKCSSGNSSRRWKLRDILPSSQGLLGAFTTVSWSNRNLRPF
ncbi:hypothetical protein CTI12_AA385580 [Artemisia annua]|uniref:Uncharacterized protein n=1 Tax=Artemisia annua TaxID=35608 RepID=A0A2U1MFW0_ARTAN|nr:hypothetical protein CTI12_AA385580 [Artemisia annua]